jgi:hypothetical protein
VSRIPFARRVDVIAILLAGFLGAVLSAQDNQTPPAPNPPGAAAPAANPAAGAQAAKPAPAPQAPAVAESTPITETIRAGSTLALGIASPQITLTSPPARGKVKVTEVAGTPKTFQLLYTAPQTSSVFTESFSFTNPTLHTVTVTVVPGDEVVYSEAFKGLFVVFVIALLLESGLATLFNWRPFVETFDGRGVKTVISVAAALVFIRGFKLDIVTRLVNIYSQTDTPFENGPLGYIITALVVAGGSAAVNNLLIALGFRSVKTADEVRPKPPKTKGWVAVALNRKEAVGPVDVLIGDPAGGDPPIAGTISGDKRREGFVRFFLRDRSRFPMSGGFELPEGTNCKVIVKGKDADGKEITAEWGPEKIAAGAIVDLELTL